MAEWNDGPRPADHRLVTPSKYRNIYHVGEQILLALTTGAATTYEVRNYYGQLVDSGLIDTVNNQIIVPPQPPGWYKVYLIRPTSLGDPWRFAGGEDSFCVVRTGGPLAARPALGTPRISPGGDIWTDGKSPAERAFTGLGPHRLVVEAYDPSLWDLPAAKIDITDEQTWYVDDPVRPRLPFISFHAHYGLVNDPAKNAGIATVLSELMVPPYNIEYFEGWNEPNASSATPENFATSTALVKAAMTAADPAAKLIGPCSVNIHDVAWTRDVLALAGSHYDGISFHNYNGVNGDLRLGRRTFDDFVAMLTSLGQQNKPRINSEAGSSFMAVYGSFEPRLQAYRTMLEWHLAEQYAVPKENMHYFYDWSHGFWSFPSFWVLNNAGEPHAGPLHVLMRVWSEELFGKAYVERLDFGSDGDFWLGCRFEDPVTGHSLVTLQAANHVGQVRLEVTGAASLQVTSPWGVVTTVPVTGGIAVVDVTELPHYVAVPAGVTAVPTVVDYGVDIFDRPGVSVTASSAATGVPPLWLHSHRDDLETATDFHGADDTFPTWVRLNFPRVSLFDRVTVNCPPPWQLASSMLDFTLEYLEDDGVTWTEIGSATEDPDTFQWSSAQAMGAGFSDSYYSRRNVWLFKLDEPVRGLAVRITCNDATWGGGALEMSGDGAGIPGGITGQGGPHRLSLRKVGVYLETGLSTPTID